LRLDRQELRFEYPADGVALDHSDAQGIELRVAEHVRG
jgi:hypothetical protein